MHMMQFDGHNLRSFQQPIILSIQRVADVSLGTEKACDCQKSRCSFSWTRL